MYWSVSLSVSGGRSGDLFSPMRPGLRYTVKHLRELRHVEVMSLTCQTTSINEGLVPLWGFNIKKVEKHVKNDFLRLRK